MSVQTQKMYRVADSELCKIDDIIHDAEPKLNIVSIRLQAMHHGEYWSLNLITTAHEREASRANFHLLNSNHLIPEIQLKDGPTVEEFP